MKKKDLDTLRKMLDEEKRKILRHLEDLTESSEVGLQDNTGDEVDIASLEINQAALAKIGKREQYLLKKIDHAIEKMDNETYGECEQCGEEIAVARLMARPVAQLCIDCKTEQENVERRYSKRDEEEEEDGESEETEEI